MNDVAIRCCSVTKSFDRVQAVAGADLRLERGSILALLGPSGCGKTTMLRLIAGFESPDAGLIEIGGRRVADGLSCVAPEKRRVAMVFQDYALFPHLDVAHNVAYGLPRGKARESRVQAMLSLVGLDGHGTRMPHELSGGQQQRVALARALAPEPDVVLLDEPFSNLDAGLRAKVRAEVQEILRAAGATAIFVTHDREEALSVADQVGVMLDGRIVQVAAPWEIYHHPATKDVATLVGDADFLPGEVENGFVTCEAGTLRVVNDLSGPVDVMLRPESVGLALDPFSRCEVIRLEFFGRDQVLTVRLASGRAIHARVPSAACFAMGDRVRIRVGDDEAVVFPSEREGDCLTASAHLASCIPLVASS